MDQLNPTQTKIWIATTRAEGADVPGWEFGSCIWAPTTDRRGVPGRYKLILDLTVGEQVIHIRNSVFTGTSFVARRAYAVDPPPNPGPWSFAKKFHRVDMQGFRPFRFQPSVGDFIDSNQHEIFRDISDYQPMRYPFAVYHYHAKPPEIKPVQGRFLTLATVFLKRAIDDATGESHV